MRNNRERNNCLKKIQIIHSIQIHSNTSWRAEQTHPTMALLPGNKAPDFTLNSVLEGREEKVNFNIILSKIISRFKIIDMSTSIQVNLSQFRGQHVLVMFYPVDFGYVTPTEFYSLAPLLSSLENMNCALLAISTEHISSQKKSQMSPR